MKTKMIKLSVIAVFGVLLMGCTKDFDEINTNPNASADAPITKYRLIASGIPVTLILMPGRI